MLSLPLRKCGLKPTVTTGNTVAITVTSLAEVWIETLCCGYEQSDNTVTSLAEVWIETIHIVKCMKSAEVTSLAEVWIETESETHYVALIQVTSLAEVWIETLSFGKSVSPKYGHFPCGSVD